jgi:hypothetical protein
MEFTALFLAVAIAMLAAWRGPRSLALTNCCCMNVVSTLLECGLGACAEDPVAYELLKR